MWLVTVHAPSQPNGIGFGTQMRRLVFRKIRCATAPR